MTDLVINQTLLPKVYLRLFAAILDSTAVAIPSIWGTPMFAAVSRSTGRTASLYRVVRKAKDDVEKRDVLKCNVYQVIETAHTSQLLFSCGFFGKVSAPQFYFLDSRFELHVHPLPPEKPKSAILAGKKLLSSGTEEASSLEDAPMATEDLSSAVTCAAVSVLKIRVVRRRCSCLLSLLLL